MGSMILTSNFKPVLAEIGHFVVFGTAILPYSRLLFFSKKTKIYVES